MDDTSTSIGREKHRDKSRGGLRLLILSDMEIGDETFYIHLLYRCAYELCSLPLRSDRYKTDIDVEWMTRRIEPGALREQLDRYRGFGG